MKLDILAIGVHPDDVELGCGGTLLTHQAMGYKTGILDLTMGQLGTRGTPELRIEEANAAGEILKVSARENLGMEDGFFVNDKEHQLKIIEIIRKYQPDIVLTNAITDRHPDHGRAAQLSSDACFLSGLKKIETLHKGESQKAWRPKVVYHYIQALYQKPDLVVDISTVFDEKMKAILAYKSQFFDPNNSEENTFISSPEFLDFVKARSLDFGKIIGVKHGEGFTTQRQIGVTDLTDLF